MTPDARKDDPPGRGDPDDPGRSSLVPKTTMVGLGPESVRASGESLKHTLMGPGPSLVLPPGPAVEPGPSDDDDDDGPPPSPVPAALKNTFVGVGPLAPPSANAPATTSAPPAATSSTPAPRPSLKATLVGPGLRDEAHATASRLSPPPELGEGTLFAGDLRILRRIARGGMGTVYEAEQLSTGRRRALKILHRAQALDERQRQRFLQEARITSRIESEHIVDVVVAGADASTGTFWIAMELLDGETLAERLMRLAPGAPLPDAESWRILTQLSRGLARAHAQGVVHRDLKPANVFLAKGDPFTVKLLDFGIAHLLDDDVDSSEGPLGTPLWMAPEQARRGEITPTADIWAAGLLGFRLFAGRSYWLSARKPVVEMSSLLAEMLDRPLPRASERAEALGCPRRLPDGFDGWFARCVARDPGLRFRSADEMAIALQQIVPDVNAMPVIEYTPASARQHTPVLARPYPRRDSARPPSPLGRAIVEDEVRVPPHAAPLDEAPEAPPSPIPLTRPATRSSDPTRSLEPARPSDATRSAEPRPRAETPDQDSMVRERPLSLRSSPPPELEAPAPARRPLSPAEQTLKLPALTELEPTGPSLRAVVAFGVLTGLGAAAVGVAVTRARQPAPVVLPAPAPAPLPAPPDGRWVFGTGRLWNGRMTSDAADWSFVMVLRQVEAGQVEGYVSWTAVRAPNARPGEQVRENLEGNWDEGTRTLELHGTASSNPFVLPVNAYRLTAAPDGALTGTSMDSSSQITGRAAARMRR
ncbi:MAG: protein kinase [Polyangiales bacterium]